MPDQGVIYYATGEQHIRQAAISAKSVKKHTDLHVTLYADRGAESPYIDSVVEITPSGHPFYDRIDYFKQTPYDQTIYLDTDTYVVGDITPIFEVLGRFDITAAHDEFRDTTAEHLSFETIEIDVPETFPEFQCGVIGYQNTEAVQALFDDWQRRYRPYRNRNLLDQPHFREALYHNPVAVNTLPSEYNVQVNFGGFLYDDAKVLHYAGENVPFIGTETPREDISEQIARELNADAPSSRAAIVETNDGIHTRPTLVPTLRYRISLSVRERGIAGTLRRAAEKVISGDLS